MAEHVAPNQTSRASPMPNARRRVQLPPPTALNVQSGIGLGRSTRTNQRRLQLPSPCWPLPFRQVLVPRSREDRDAEPQASPRAFQEVCAGLAWVPRVPQAACCNLCTVQHSEGVVVVAPDAIPSSVSGPQLCTSLPAAVLIQGCGRCTDPVPYYTELPTPCNTVVQ